MSNNMPRLVFAAPKSGSGKTMIVCGVIEALKKRGLDIAVFKCGPDYIDTMFHKKVLGVETGNIDTFFTDSDMTNYILSQKAEKADITVIEGVMGYYDGVGGVSEKGSTYDISSVTKSPVVLIAECKGASVSVAPMIKGIIEYRNDSNIKAIILNRVSENYYTRIKEVVERETGVKVIGYMPDIKNMEVPSRHLGLISPDEIDSFKKWAENIALEVEKNINVDEIINIAQSAPAIKADIPYIPRLKDSVKIAVARDEAFSFYYSENIELIEKMGGEIVYFSPLANEKVPDDADGIILWGGYPERFAQRLENAADARKSVYENCKKGMPCIGECGGFMYLMDEMEDTEGVTHKMCGVIRGKAHKGSRLARFGYISAKTLKSSILGGEGTVIKGHEFHYWDSDNNGEDAIAFKPLSDREYRCMHCRGNVAAGYPHFYYYSNINMLYEFMESCLMYRCKRLSKKHWDMIAKPIDSLGRLEDIVVKLCGIYKSPETPYIKKRCLVIMCGDHGVVKEGVTQTGSDVTRTVSENFAKGVSCVNYMAEVSDTDVFAVDIGMDCENYSNKKIKTGHITDCKIERGTKNIFREPAMTRENCIKAINTGINIAGELSKRGYKIIATGEMGIGNTTPAAIVTAVLTESDAERVTGKGAGLCEEGYLRKKEVVRAVVERIREKGYEDAVDVMAEGGGYEIAGMAGLFLGGMKYGTAVVIDGAISAAAALCAYAIDERVIDYIIASHNSAESMCSLVLKRLGLKAVIEGEMCLGEGSGAVAVFPLIDMALNVYDKMGSFDEYSIDAYKRYDKEENNVHTRR